MDSEETKPPAVSLPLCQLCDAAQPVIFCKECTQSMCQSCKLQHDEVHSFGSHMTSPLCRTHVQPVTHVCHECIEGMCIKCIIKSHKTHWANFTSFDDGVKMLKDKAEQDAASILNQREEVKTKFEEVKKEFTRMKAIKAGSSQLRAAYVDKISKIDNIVNNIDELYESQEDQTIKLFEKVQERCSDLAGNFRKECDCDLDFLERIQSLSLEKNELLTESKRLLDKDTKSPLVKQGDETTELMHKAYSLYQRSRSTRSGSIPILDLDAAQYDGNWIDITAVNSTGGPAVLVADYTTTRLLMIDLEGKITWKYEEEDPMEDEEAEDYNCFDNEMETVYRTLSTCCIDKNREKTDEDNEKFKGDDQEECGKGDKNSEVEEDDIDPEYLPDLVDDAETSGEGDESNEMEEDDSDPEYLWDSEKEEMFDYDDDVGITSLSVYKNCAYFSQYETISVVPIAAPEEDSASDSKESKSTRNKTECQEVYNPDVESITSIGVVDEDTIVVATEGDGLKRFSPTTGFIDSLENEGESYFISVEEDVENFKLAQSDIYDHKIYTYDRHVMLAEIDFLRPDEPHGSAFTDSGDILVAVWSSHQVIRFSPFGNRQECILAEKDGLKYPTAVAYQKPHLWVLERFISVDEPRRNRLKCFIIDIEEKSDQMDQMI